jgi:two-component system sensor histidine kinase HydH
MNPAETEDRVYGDADKLKQVFLNILLNSLQACLDQGRIDVTVLTTDTEVVCQVEDSGIGVEDDHLARVFDPYFTTKNNGTGLGLAISSKIVEEHGGTVSMVSEQGRGTCVTVRLPSFNVA